MLTSLHVLNSIPSYSSTDEDVCFQLSYLQRLSGFGLFLACGVIFLIMSVYRAPFILLGRADKFAVPYTFANVLLLSSTLFLVGYKKQIAEMTSNHRFYAFVMYVFSLAFTLYSALIMQSWVFVMISIFVQFASLAWYAMSYIPFARTLVSNLISCCCKRTASLVE